MRCGYRSFLYVLLLSGGLAAQVNPPPAATPPVRQPAAPAPAAPAVPVPAPAVPAPAPAVPAPAPAAPAPAAPLPSIDSVFPTTTYPVRDRFAFDINGQNFDKDPQNDVVEVLGQGTLEFKSRFQAPATAATQKKDEPPKECSGITDEAQLPCLEATADGRRLIVYGYPRGHAYQGPMQVRVSTKSGSSSWSGLFTLSRVNYRIIIATTIILFALLAYTVYRLVASGMQDYTVAGRRYSPLAAFLIDKTTDTYSLSKFQLFALSLVAFFGYLYVFLCRTLVQWQFTFPDIPDNYPSLLAISAGTTAAAIGLNATRGGNGGGPVHPSPADFISNGGMVVAERFQFFVWTLIACIGFIALILMQDPATVSGFPSFPNGLLYVMGVSAGGYLGGKAVRNPGPILKKIAVSINAAKNTDLDIVLDGSNLDKDAKFRIDGAAQTPVGTVTWSQAAGEPGGYSDQLKFTLSQAAGFFDGDHTFEITNGDGIGAQQIFTGRPITITKVDPAVITHGTTVKVTLDVTDYREKSTARWLPPGASSAIQIPMSDVGPATPAPSPGTSSKVPVKVPAGPATGSGTLTLVSPAGGTEAATLNVN